MEKLTEIQIKEGSRKLAELMGLQSESKYLNKIKQL